MSQGNQQINDGMFTLEYTSNMPITVISGIIFILSLALMLGVYFYIIFGQDVTGKATAPSFNYSNNNKNNIVNSFQGLNSSNPQGQAITGFPLNQKNQALQQTFPLNQKNQALQQTFQNKIFQNKNNILERIDENMQNESEDENINLEDLQELEYEYYEDKLKNKYKNNFLKHGHIQQCNKNNMQRNFIEETSRGGLQRIKPEEIKKENTQNSLKKGFNPTASMRFMKKAKK
mgnify:CR=1 FL=1